MLKWLHRIAIFLLLGAIVNVAVAWGCVLARGDVTQGARRLRYQGIGHRTFIEMGSGFGCQYVAEFPPFPRDLTIFVNARPPLYTGRTWWTNEPQYGSVTTAHIACGWPMLAVSSTLVPEPLWVEQVNPPLTVKGGLVVDASAPTHALETPLPTVLPYHPLWIGLLVNSSLYASAIGMLLLASVAARRVIRLRRNQCPTCGYPRG